MIAENVLEQIEKLIDVKLNAAAILTSKSLGTSKEFFFEESRQDIEKTRLRLLEALKNSPG